MSDSNEDNLSEITEGDQHEDLDENAQQHPDRVLRIADEGCIIGVFTMVEPPPLFCGV